MHGMIKTKEPRFPKTASNEFPWRVFVFHGFKLLNRCESMCLKRKKIHRFISGLCDLEVFFSFDINLVVGAIVDLTTLFSVHIYLMISSTCIKLLPSV